MRDWVNDIKTNTRTFAVISGLKNTQRIYAIFLEAERLSLGVLVITLYLKLDDSLKLFGYHFPLAFILILIYLPLILLTIGNSIKAYKNQNLQQMDPYDEDRQRQKLDWLQIIHHSFPGVFMPFFLGILLSIKYPPYLFFILIISLIYGNNILSFGKKIISFFSSR